MTETYACAECDKTLYKDRKGVLRHWETHRTDCKPKETGKGPTPESLAKSNTEAAHQTALMCWCNLPEIQFQYPELQSLFHIPNGGTRDKIEAGHLKSQGVKAGVPDLFLPVARHGKHGLFIEMKIAPNKASAQQQTWIEDLRSQNYGAAIAWSWIEAAQMLELYLNEGK